MMSSFKLDIFDDSTSYILLANPLKKSDIDLEAKRYNLLISSEKKDVIYRSDTKNTPYKIIIIKNDMNIVSNSEIIQ